MERDQFLCEMMGKCWHEWEWISGGGLICKKCPIDLYGGRITYEMVRKPPPKPNYSTSPADILALQQFALGAEWWPKFWKWVWFKKNTFPGDRAIREDYEFTRWLFSSPDRFASLVAEFRGWRNE